MNLIYSKAKGVGTDPEAVAAIAWHESNGFVYAVEYLKNYDDFCRPGHFAKYQRITVETEQALQSQRYGLCQILGANARRLGFDGPLPALYKPENNLYWTCRHLVKLGSKYTDFGPELWRAYRRANGDTDGGEFAQAVAALYEELQIRRTA